MKSQYIKLIETYGQAWVTQDPDLILTIFTPDATYDDPAEPKNYGHEGIRDYWVNKVVNQQRNITFTLLNVWMENDTVIAEWASEFDDVKRQLHVALRETSIFTVRGDKFSALREYYASVKMPLLMK